MFACMTDKAIFSVGLIIYFHAALCYSFPLFSHCHTHTHTQTAYTSSFSSKKGTGAYVDNAIRQKFENYPESKVWGRFKQVWYWEGRENRVYFSPSGTTSSMVSATMLPAVSLFLAFISLELIKYIFCWLLQLSRLVWVIELHILEHIKLVSYRLGEDMKKRGIARAS